VFVADNIDTRTVLDIIRKLVVKCNECMSEDKNPSILLLLKDIAAYITKIFIIFGAISSSHDSIGFPIDDDEAVGTNVRSPFRPPSLSCDKF
jgi:cysteinyl-tRNA synthetase